MQMQTQNLNTSEHNSKHNHRLAPGRRLLMKHMNYPNKAVALSGIFMAVILLGAILFAASSDSGGRIITEPDTFEAKLFLEQLNASKNLNLHFDNINDATVTLEASGDKIDMAYLVIYVSDKISDSDMNSISEYIQNYFDYLKKEQIAITYVDSSYKVLKSVCSAP